MIILVCTCFFLFANGLIGQESDDLSPGQVHYNSGKQLLKAGDLNYAREQTLRALDYFEKDQDWNNYYNSINQYRKTGIKLGEYQASYDSLLVWEQRVPVTESKVRGRIIFYQAYFLNNMLGQQVAGIQKYKETIAPLRSAQDTNFLMGSLENISYGYSKLGDQLSAINYQKEAYNLAKTWSKQKRICSIVNTLGKYYFHDDQFDNAQETYLLALGLCKNNDFTHLNLAELYIRLNDLAEAKKHLELIDDQDPDVQIEFNLIKAQYFKANSQYDDAALTHALSLDQLNDYWDRRKYIREMVRYAELLNLDNRPEEAISYAHQAICEFIDCSDSLDYMIRPDVNILISEIWIIEALYIKAKYFQNRYAAFQSTQSKEEAIFYYQYLFDLFDTLRDNYYTSGSKYRIGAYAQKIYADAVDFLVRLYEEENDLQYFELAFQISQRANAFVLKNTLSERQALELAGVSRDSIDQYHHLSLLLREQIEKDSLDDGYYELSETFENYRRSLRQNYRFSNTSSNQYQISLADLKSELEPGSALLKYFQHEEKLYAFVISRSDQFMRRIPITQDFDSLMKVQNNAMTLLNSFSESNVENESDYLSNSKAIYDLIIGDLLDQSLFESIDHIIIVPDGKIKQISFSTIVHKASDDWTKPDNYLLSRFAFSYLYYCAQIKKSDRHQRRTGGFVGMGIEYEDAFLEEVLEQFKHSIQDNLNEEELRGLYMAPLKFAVDEVERCAKILQGQYFINQEVNQGSILEKIKNRKIIHFSVHALVDEADYFNSFILLNKDAKQDFQLSYKEVLKENINSDLVVLSACQTGLGHNVVGEGLMSMTRAFIQSGSDATLGSYWNAPDKPTMELMELFYANIQKGMTKSKALQNAQLTYLSDDIRSTPLVRAPHFWGAWVIYGSDEAIQLGSSYNIYFLGAGILILLILVIFLFIINKRRKQ